MMERELADAIEVFPDRLYWVALHSLPRNTAKSHYFSIDNDLIYEPFYADFGPLNLSMVYRYTKMLEAKLSDPHNQEKRIIHYCSHDPKKRANAAFLICAYQVIVQGKSSDAAYEPFHSSYPPFLPFRDAIRGGCLYQCTILDCLKGLEHGIANRWFDYARFDVEAYEFFEKVENGDMNWIIPERFLAFAGPCPTPTDADGFPSFTPEDYVPIFREAGIGLVVRLNKKQYDQRRFIDHNIKHVDLYFLDGSCPSPEIITKFLHITESEPSAVAVHCKAGLGRTGTLIGLYAMKHFQIPARAFIGWNRICRPGSILGPQQQFLLDMQQDMFQAGAAFRGPSRALGPPGGAEALAHKVEKMSIRERSQAEKVEDVGQGESLVNAKRGVGGASPGGGLAGTFGLGVGAGSLGERGAGPPMQPRMGQAPAVLSAAAPRRVTAYPLASAAGGGGIGGGLVTNGAGMRDPRLSGQAANGASSRSLKSVFHRGGAARAA